MNLKTLGIITAALCGGAAMARDGADRHHDGSRRAWTRVHCRSSNYNFNRCDTGMSEIWNVQVIERKSNARCEFGNSWGIRGSDIWVDHGCEAIFGVSGRW